MTHTAIRNITTKLTEAIVVVADLVLLMWAVKSEGVATPGVVTAWCLAAIAKYDLLCHPFYRAWAAGELSRNDLRQYALDYFPHVEAFPTYLAEFAIRLEDGELRRAVLANMADEKGLDDVTGERSRPHSDLWLDFAEGMGARREIAGCSPMPEMNELLAFFHGVASEGAPEEALAAFYAYESQVPRVASEKARGLQEKYGADQPTSAYFTLHATADVYHSQVLRLQLSKRLQAHPVLAERALASAGIAAKALWLALDWIEARRRAQAA